MTEPTGIPRSPAAEDERNDAEDGLASADAFDPVLEVYKQHVDRTILRENLKLSPQERSEKFVSFMKSVWQLREIAERERRG